MSAPAKPVALGIIALMLAACATRTAVPEIPLLESSPMPSATRSAERPPDRSTERSTERSIEIVEVPTPVPLPGQLKALPTLQEKAQEKGKEERPSPERIGAANAAARIEPVKDGFINAIQVYPYAKGALYQLYGAVGQVSDIALEPAEKLISVSAGDTLRWVLGDTTSGEGKDAVVHILVKPIQADLETNLVITTDRRTYHLELRSTPSAYMASLSWTYPASELMSLKKPRGESEPAPSIPGEGTVDPERLRFRYRIEGNAPFKPTRVFDDGSKVYIQFPSGLAQSEAPPLFVIGPDGKPGLVNYRVRGTTYIVDRLFAAAELRLGTSPQRVVRIVRTDAVWREAQP